MLNMYSNKLVYLCQCLVLPDMTDQENMKEGCDGYDNYNFIMYKDMIQVAEQLSTAIHVCF